MPMKDFVELEEVKKNERRMGKNVWYKGEF